MSGTVPLTFRCMIPVSSRKSRILSATSDQSLRRIYAHVVLPYGLCDPGEQCNWKKSFFKMASPREIADLSEGINSLSASLADLKNNVQGLAKVDVHKLESVHSPRQLNQRESSGMDAHELEEIRNLQKIEEGSKSALDLGKSSRFAGANLDEGTAAERGSLTVGKSDEEESALGEILANIQGRGALGNLSRIEDMAQGEGQEAVGKLEAANVGKHEIGNDGSKLERPREGEMNLGKAQVEKVGKIEEDTGRTDSTAKPVTELDLGKTQVGKMGKIEGDVGKTESVVKPVTEVNVGKTQVENMGKIEGEVGKTESADFTNVSDVRCRPVQSSKLEGVVAKPVTELDVGKAQVEEGGTMDDDGGKTQFADFTGFGHGVQGSKLEEDGVKAGGTMDIGKSQTESVGKSEQGNDIGQVKLDNATGQSKLEKNIANLYASFGADAPAGLVGKTEGRDILPSPDSFTESVQRGKPAEGGGVHASGASKQNVKLEENVRKLHESFGDFHDSGLVGKTEGRDVLSTAGTFTEAAVLPGAQDDLSTAERSMETSEIEGETRKVGQMEADKIAKAENDLEYSPAEVKSKVTKPLVGNEATKADRNIDEGKRNTGFCIYLASKDSAADESIEKLMYGDGLDLPDGAIMVVAAEATKAKVREVFDVDLYFTNLGTSQFGRLLMYSPLLPSTHTLLSQNFHSVPVASVCVAGAQLQGKGRAGNLWHSPEGCLMFSFTVQMTNGHQVPFLQYVVSLAIIEAVMANCNARRVPCPDLRIKWPNDLYANGQKIGGVLCTSSYRNKTFNIVVGVGLNVGNRQPTTCLDALIEDSWGQPFAIQQEELLAAIMLKFAKLNAIFQDQGFSPLQDEYCRKWLHGGQSVILEEKDAETQTASNVSVIIRGLTPTGYLLATDGVGQQYELHPDGNSFDFLNGLVRRKLPA